MSKKMNIKGNQNTQVAGDLHSNHIVINQNISVTILSTPEAARAYAQEKHALESLGVSLKKEVKNNDLIDMLLSKKGAEGTKALAEIDLKKIDLEKVTYTYWISSYFSSQKRFKETLQLSSLATLKKALKLTDLWDFMPTEMYALVLEAFLKKPKSNPTEIGYGF